jgi:hypothetical protein
MIPSAFFSRLSFGLIQKKLQQNLKKNVVNFNYRNNQITERTSIHHLSHSLQLQSFFLVNETSVGSGR